MTTLVTGGSGFVGSAIVRRLLDAGHEVRALVRESSSLANLEGLPVEVVTGDLLDADSLARAVKGCTAVFHVAADYRLWTPNPAEIYEANVTGTANVMHAAAAAGCSRIVYTSSVATLGTVPGGSPADEETPASIADMIGHYKRSKFLAEAEVRRLIARENIPAVIVNPSAPVGPRDIKPTPTGRMIVEAAAGRMPAYMETGLNVVHVDDVAEGHLRAFERGRVGERYILGGTNMTLREILGEIAALTGRAAPRIKLSHRVVMPIAFVAEAVARISGGEPVATVDSVRMAKKLMYFSSDKARRELGYQPKTARAALADAVDWFEARGYLS
ncbi:MAG TPA: hopanoid-associated sugar epimerase [Alphaproteobacteria bacterium]|jgi:dihydroflavonol-4-reductase|nr:hopanoid-associated sugar epimerase [Alphaproteobacteria bacterium]